MIPCVIRRGVPYAGVIFTLLTGVLFVLTAVVVMDWLMKNSPNSEEPVCLDIIHSV